MGVINPIGSSDPTTDLGPWGMSGNGATLITPTLNQLHVVKVWVPGLVTLTGIAYTVWTGSATTHVLVSLYSNTGTLLAQSASTTVSAAQGAQKVPFTAPRATSPGAYFIGIMFDATVASLSAGDSTLDASNTQTQGAFTLPATLTPPSVSDFNPHPAVATY